jgi:hypothetical protein
VKKNEFIGERKMGRSRTPTKQKLLKGTFRADQDLDIPSPPITKEINDPPAHLGVFRQVCIQ